MTVIDLLVVHHISKLGTSHLCRLSCPCNTWDAGDGPGSTARSPAPSASPTRCQLPGGVHRDRRSQIQSSRDPKAGAAELKKSLCVSKPSLQSTPRLPRRSREPLSPWHEGTGETQALNSPSHRSLPSTQGRGGTRIRSLHFSGLTRLFPSSQDTAAATRTTPRTPPPPLGPQTARGGAGLCGRGSSCTWRGRGESQHSSQHKPRVSQVDLAPKTVPRMP